MMRTTPDEPYCKECGYSLQGLTESSKCPECGKPIVEVLVRDVFPGMRGRRYQSAQRIWGMPLVSIATGPYGDERRGHAVGFIAIGDTARGVVAIGGRAVGLIAVGGIALGGISIGGLAIGAIALGGAAAGLFSLGGYAMGLCAMGGTVVVVYKGIGGGVIYVP